MFSAEDKENNAKSSTDDKSTSKTFARRSVLREFDPFYSSPQQQVNKPTAINEECEEENVASDDNRVNKNPEKDFEVTPKTTQKSTDSSIEHVQITEEKLQEEHPENVKEVDKTVGNDYSSQVFSFTPNENCSLESERNSSMMETPEKSAENQPLTQYFECQEQKNDIVFVNAQFDATFDQTQNMEAFDPLGSSFLNKTVDPFEQDSVYEECLDTTFTDPSKIDSAEPENEEILEIINRSFEEALDGNDVEIEDSQDTVSVENVASIDGCEANVENSVTTNVHGEVQSIKKEDTEEEDTSFAIKGADNQKDVSFVIEEAEPSEKNIEGNLVIEDFESAEPKTCSFVDDVAEDAVGSFKEIEVSSNLNNCEATDDKSTNIVRLEGQHKNASFVVAETEKNLISEANEVDTAQDAEEIDVKPLDINFEANSNQDIQEPAEVCDDQRQNASFVIVETCESLPKVEASEGRGSAFEAVGEVQHKNASFVIEDIISEATESAQNIKGTDDKAMDTNFEGKNETTLEDQPKDVSFVVGEAKLNPKDVSFEAVKANITASETVHKDQHENDTVVLEQTGKNPNGAIFGATEVEFAQNIKGTVETTHEDQHKVKDVSFVVEEAKLSPKDVSFEAVEAKRTASEIVHKDQHTFVTEEIGTIPKDTTFEATEVEFTQNFTTTDGKAMDTTFEGKNETVETSHVSVVVEQAVRSPKNVRFEAVEAKITASEIVHKDQHETDTFVPEETGKIPKDTTFEATEVESSENITKTDGEAMDTTFEGKNVSVETSYVAFVVEEAARNPKEVGFEAVEAKRTDFEVVHGDQHENATFVAEEIGKVLKGIISEVEFSQNVNGADDKAINTTFEGENATAETSHENQHKDVSLVVEEAVQSPKNVSFEANITAFEIVDYYQHETENLSKDIISEASKVDLAQNANDTVDKPMNTTFEGENEAVRTSPEDASFVEQSPKYVGFEVVEVSSAAFEKVQDGTAFEVVHKDQHEQDSLVTDDTAVDTTFEGKTATTHMCQPKDVSFVIEQAAQKEVSFEAEIVHDSQHENATFTTGEASKDLLSEASEVEFAQNVYETDDRPMNTTFEGKTEASASFVVEEAVQVPNDATFEATTVQGRKETDDEPIHITFETNNSSPKNEKMHVKSVDEPMETSFVVVEAEVNYTETGDEPMDITVEANQSPSDASFIVEEILKPQDVTFCEIEVKSADETLAQETNMPIDTTFEAEVKTAEETEDKFAQETNTTFEAETEAINRRLSFNVGAGTSFIISDEHTAESTKCAEALAQSLNQTIDVEESAIVEDIDAIDNFNVTIEAATSEDSPDDANEIVHKAETVEDAKSENAESLNVPEVAEKLHISEPIKSPPKPKRLECRPNIRPLRNKTQVIENPVVLQQPESQTLEADNLDFEINLLQTELKRIKEENAKKDQRILEHAMKRESTKETVRKYEHIAREYHNHVKMQSEDLKRTRRSADQVAANLTSTEMAFSVLFKNYEKAKSAIESYKKNESMLLEEINKLEEKLTVVDSEYKSVEDECNKDIKTAQQEADQKKEAYKQDLANLQAKVKRLNIKASSLESSLSQKTEECQALATLCDDILKDKPSSVS